MSHDRRVWEGRYRGALAGEVHPAADATPSDFLCAHAHLIHGRVLDVAAGAGRNALFLARRGNVVDAIDIAFNGLQRALASARASDLPVRAVQADLEEFPLPRARYDAVIVVRYLQRSQFGALHDAVKVGGIILYETFLIDQQAVGHPRNPTFLLQHGELRAAFPDYEMLVYEEGQFGTVEQPTFLARMVARRRGRD